MSCNWKCQKLRKVRKVALLKLSLPFFAYLACLSRCKMWNSSIWSSNPLIKIGIANRDLDDGLLFKIFPRLAFSCINADFLQLKKHFSAYVKLYINTFISFHNSTFSNICTIFERQNAMLHKFMNRSRILISRFFSKYFVRDSDNIGAKINVFSGVSKNLLELRTFFHKM